MLPALNRRARLLCRVGLTAPILLFALVACVSTTASPDAKTTSVAPVTLGYEEMLAEFRAEAAVLPLPDGVAWIEPAEPKPEMLPNGKLGSTSYEPNVGIGAAGNQWFCFWIEEWLATRGVDAAAESAALEAMNRFVDTKAFIETLDPQSAQAGVLALLQQANLGDPSGAASYDEIGCKWWLMPAPSDLTS